MSSVLSIVLPIAFVLAFIAVQCLVMRLVARREGFKPVTYNLSELGPIIQTYRWGSVQIGKSARWGRAVTITLFHKHIHLKMNKGFGGGEILLPLESAEYSFSSWMNDEVVSIAIHGKTYVFGKKVTKIVKQHYCC